METPKEYYYTYYSYEEWGRGYIGSRKCYCLPEEDIKYFGSFRDKTFKPTQKIILKYDYTTREEAYVDEIILQEYYKVVENPHFANRSYQTSLKFHYVPSKEEATKNGKKGLKKQKENNIGYFGIDLDKRKIICKKGGSVAGPKTYKLGVGVHGLTKKQNSQNGKKSGGIGGKKAYELGLGVHGRSKEKMSNDGKKGGIVGGKISGRNTYENKIGIHSQTKEQLSELGKNTGNQKWQCLETGFITNAGNLTKYQRARGICTLKRLRIV